MAMIEDIVGGIFEGEVKIKKGNGQKNRNNKSSSSSLVGRLRLVVNKAPEVMVKITGFSRSSGRVASHIEYISNEGEDQLENDRGEIFKGREEMEESYSNWIDDIESFPKSSSGKETRHAMHLMLSMPAGTDPEKVRDSVRDFAKETFSENHEYLFALHTHQNNPHVHLAVKMLGHDQQRLNPRKADLQEWREGFAEQLRAKGVDAVASNRKARGVVKKATKGTVWQINNKPRSDGKKRTAETTKGQHKEAARELIAESKGQKIPSKPWVKPIAEGQQEVRQLYEKLATELDKTDSKENKQLSNDVKKFLSSMPSQLVTQNDQIKQQIIREATKVKDAVPQKGVAPER